MVCVVQSVSHELVHRLDRTTHVAHYKSVNIVPKKQHGYDSQPFRASISLYCVIFHYLGNSFHNKIVKYTMKQCCSN